MDLGNIDWSKLGIDPADTKSDESPEVEVAQIESAHPALRSRLRVRLERKGRGGKMATVVDGFAGTDRQLLSLAATLKARLGIGGSAKDGLLILQGDCRPRVVDMLRQLGYSDVK